MGLELLLPLMIVVLIVLMVLQSTRQRRTMKDMRKMQASLTAGDRVLTTSGLRATIVSVGDETVELEIAEGVHTQWDRRVIREKIDAGTPPGADTGTGAADSL